MAEERKAQLSYSDLQAEMLDEDLRRKKGAKIVTMLEHFLGGEGALKDKVAIDLGCSAGFISHELHKAGAAVTGVDIDEPGLEKARARFGGEVAFRHADGTALPWEDASVDALVFNQIYEHVVDPAGVMSEIRRVLRPDGVVYLGLSNRMTLMEPHYRLPLLSWFPGPVADRYVAATGRADSYYERLHTRPWLRRMCRGLNVWDYTYTVLADPVRFQADDMVPQRLRSAPQVMWKALTPILPTYLWLGTPGTSSPRGPAATVPPTRVKGVPAA